MSPRAANAGRVSRIVELEVARSGRKHAKREIDSGPLDAESRAKAAPAVLEELKASEARFAELREASRRPYSQYAVVYELENPWGILLPHLAQMKGACQRLQLKACAELASSQSEKALP